MKETNNKENVFILLKNKKKVLFYDKISLKKQRKNHELKNIIITFIIILKNMKHASHKLSIEIKHENLETIANKNTG